MFDHETETSVFRLLVIHVTESTLSNVLLENLLGGI